MVDRDGTHAGSSPLPEWMAAAALVDLGLLGLSIGIALPGDVTSVVSAGVADRRAGTPVTDSTAFRIGSVSKALTSAALGALLEEGTIALEDPVVRYVPEFSDHPAGTASVRQLAAHMSGTPHYRGRDFVNRRHYESLTEALEKFKDRPSLFEPGKGFAYSSFGWNLLGLVMERASGVPFLDLMRDRVFEPLDLSGVVPESSAVAGRARPYLRLGPLTIPAPRIDPSDSWPSAGFVATTVDLARFGRAMLDGALLDRRTVALLWEVGHTESGEQTGYGLGWQVLDLAGLAAVGHGGSHVGATAALWLIPDSSLAVALATNINAPPGALTRLAEEVVEHVLTRGAA